MGRARRGASLAARFARAIYLEHRRQQCRHRGAVGRSRPWRCAPLRLPPWGQAACHCCTTLRRLFVADAHLPAVPWPRPEPGLRIREGRRSARPGHPGGSADRRARLLNSMQRALSEARSAGGKIKGRRARAKKDDDAYYVRPALCEMPEQSGPRAARNLRADSLCHCGILGLDEAIRSHNGGRRPGFPRPSSRSTCARPSASCRRRDRTAASPMSTSDPPAPRSAAHSASKNTRPEGRVGEAGSYSCEGSIQ